MCFGRGRKIRLATWPTYLKASKNLCYIKQHWQIHVITFTKFAQTSVSEWQGQTMIDPRFDKKRERDRKWSSIFWFSGPDPYRPFVLLWIVRIHWLELPQLYHRGDEGATKEILQLCLPGLKFVMTAMTSGHLKFCQRSKFFQKTTCFLA